MILILLLFSRFKNERSGIEALYDQPHADGHFPQTAWQCVEQLQVETQNFQHGSEQKADIPNEAPDDKKLRN